MRKTKSRKTANHTRKRLFVARCVRGWTIDDPSSALPPRVYTTQREALAAARELVNGQDGGEILLRGRDGRIRGVDTYALGGRSFDKINAVEGILLSQEMREDFRALDSKRLSPEKRRAWLIAKYGCPSDDLRRRK